MVSSIFKAIRSSLGLMLCLTAASCGADDKSLKEFEKMCKAEYGTTIYEKVVADGYYSDDQCIDCDRDLIKSGYSFIEFCNTKKSPSGSAHEPGCFRISKIKQEAGKCDHYVNDDNYKLAKIGEEPFKSFMKQNCLSVESLDKPTAQYRYYSKFDKYIVDKIEGAQITRSEGGFIDTNSNKILSKMISFGFTSHDAETGKAPGERSCYGTKPGEFKGSMEHYLADLTLLPNISEKGEKQ